MSKIINICTHIPSRAPEVTKRFFLEVLGFNTEFEHGSYIELGNEGLLLGIQQSEGEPISKVFMCAWKVLMLSGNHIKALFLNTMHVNLSFKSTE